ncbi:hypothetical protein BOX15_Mlig030668g5 [Macrostomum lignano]|uniref:Aminotransferase class I/classII large domain-containing protein n=1 Tax=Macrostomum lignano TaxID=282301 RepID=A0A267H3S5_9PLAT|nr:hypothetical protein BOX15_Mlig030668g5 [Macrostomum lignano]
MPTEDGKSANTGMDGLTSPWLEDFGASLLRPELGAYSPASNLSQNDVIRARQRAGEPIVNLGFGQSPFPIPQPAVDSLRQHAADGRYLPACGIPELRQAVSEFHRRLDQLDPDIFTPDGVVCGPGSKELIFLIMTVFRGTVYIGAPSWTTYRPQTLLSGRSCVTLGLSAADSWKITPEIIGANLTGDPCRLLVLANPDNPTGQVYSDSELAALAEFLRRERFIVVSDEIYARLNFSLSHRSLARLYPEGCIVTSGLSKWAGAGGWRLGYALFPRPLESFRRAVASAATHTYSCCAAPVQHAALTLLGNPEETAKHSNRSARILAALARHCERRLTEAGAVVAPAGGGFYLLPDFEVAREGLRQLLGSASKEPTGAAMCERILSDIGVALMPAGPAFLRPESELTVRLCFVEFDGAAALQAVRELELEEADNSAPLPDDFAAKYCEPTYSAVVRLADWLRSVQQA